MKWGDIGGAAVGVVLAVAAFDDAPFGRRKVLALVLLGVLNGVIVALVGAAAGLHRGRYSVGAFDEVAAVARMHLFGLASTMVANSLADPRLVDPESIVASGLFALLAAFAVRYLLRQRSDGMVGPDLERSQRALIFGAGQAGAEVVRLLIRDPISPYYPVGVIDDDPFKASRVISGVKVVGTRRDLPRLARVHRADCLIVAVPSAQPELKQELASVAASCGLHVRILPPLSELVDRSITVSQIREVSEADLLGRPQVEVDLAAISQCLHGRVVLVTGAGGSIGSEICRQVKRFEPARLVMVDRDESALHAVQLSIEGRALLADPSLVVADIRDAERIRTVFAEFRPDIVFHAAALKHLPLLEMHPQEGIKTNVWGTHNVLEAAIEAGVDQFVNISTDKAADPVSVLGSTKLLAERLTGEAALRSGCRFVSVRFGNVLGSRGSVLPTFRAQIAAGGPVTVTDPDVTRYFMTTEEAVRLVMQAAVIGLPGEVMVLDMGQPVRLDDVAKRLIAQSGKPIEIVYTGLRPGEKLHEQLIGSGEIAVRREHALIMHAATDPLGPDVVLPDLDAATLPGRAASLGRQLIARTA